jgi:heme A synthase
VRPSRVSTLAWSVLGYMLLVVLWGAYVRASGSGAGCGSHWPLCNGVVVPHTGRIATAIEFTHRITSGLALLGVAALLVCSLRAYPKGHRVRRAASVTLGFMVLEALLGAGLVLFELVAQNASMVRAFSMVAHLVNTFLLVGSLTVTAWWASGGARFRLRGSGGTGALLVLGLLGILLVGASGAIAALGDTLFPARSFAEGFRADFDPASSLLLRLRKIHPLLAPLVGLYLLAMARLAHRLRPGPGVRRFAVLLSAMVLAQILAGTLNLWLAAPIPMQLVHLLLADLLWISAVLLSAATLAVESDARPLTSTPPEFILEIR